MAYILVVDDDFDILSMAKKTFRDAGHCPVLAPNVFRALEVLNHQEPDLVGHLAWKSPLNSEHLIS